MAGENQHITDRPAVGPPPLPAAWEAAPTVRAVDGWPEPVQWLTAALLTLSLLLLAWRGWGLTSWSTRPLELQRNAFIVPFDVNQATEAELLTVPALGPALARRIHEHRQAHGPFRTMDDLLAVPGIGPATLARLSEHLGVVAPADRLAPRVVRAAPPDRPVAGKKIPPAVPLDANRATADQLMQLPGIGPTLAARIIEARSRQPFTSIGDLRRVHGIGDKTLERIRPHLRVDAPPRPE